MSECPYKPGGIYNLRGGLKMRCYRNDAPGHFKIHGSVIYPDGAESIEVWSESGKAMQIGADHKLDLLPPERPRIKVAGWFNCYRDGFGSYSNRKIADACAASDRLACVAVEFDIPEGCGLTEDMPAIIVRGE